MKTNCFLARIGLRVVSAFLGSTSFAGEPPRRRDVPPIVDALTCEVNQTTWR